MLQIHQSRPVNPNELGRIQFGFKIHNAAFDAVVAARGGGERQLVPRVEVRHRPQIDLDHPVDHGDEDEEPGTARLRHQAPEPEDDAALVLAGDLDRLEEEEDEQESRGGQRDEDGAHVLILRFRRNRQDEPVE